MDQIAHSKAYLPAIVSPVKANFIFNFVCSFFALLSRKTQTTGRQNGAEVTRRCGHGGRRQLICPPWDFVLFWNYSFQMANGLSNAFTHSFINTSTESLDQTKNSRQPQPTTSILSFYL